MRDREQKSLWICLGISGFLHLLFFVVLLLGGADLLAAMLKTDEPPEQETPKLVLLQTRPQQQQFLETDSSQQTKERPENAPFYSDRNTLAADQTSKKGETSPEIKGRKQDILATADVVLSQAVPPSPSSPKSTSEKSKPPKPDQEKPKDSEKPKENPRELVKKEYALLKPTSVEATPIDPEQVPVEAEKVEPSEMSSQESARAPPSKPSTRAIPTTASDLEGGISRKGVISFNTQESPAGHYDKILISAISHRWYALVGDRYRNQGGNVRVEFDLLSDGRVRNVTVQSDNAVGPILANLCRQAILESAPYRPFPTTLQALWGDSRRIKITFQYTF